MKKFISVSATFAFFVVLSARVATLGHAQETPAMARNPVIWADVPDPAVIRVNDTYYISSTTMHMSPGS